MDTTPFNKDYYQTGFGTIPYENAEAWMHQFRGIADRIVQDFNPKTVLDVGCAMGYLVAALRERGVEAYGIDISSYAISKVAPEYQQYCRVWSAIELLPQDMPQQYDLAVSIEVVEHLHEELAIPFLENICHYANRVLFSSSHDDFTEATHYNVQQAEYWMKRFAQIGFYRDLAYNASYIAPQAVCLYRGEHEPFQLVENYEHAFRYEKALWKKQEIINVELVNNMERERSEKGATLAAAASKQAALEAELVKQIELLEALQDKCDSLRKERNTGEDTCASLRNEIAEWDNTCASLRNEIAEWDNTCASLRDELACNEETNKALQACLEECQAEQDALRHEIVEYSNLVAYERSIMAKTSEDMQQYKQAYESICQAACWKMTKPLRVVLDGIKRLAHLLKKAVVYLARHGLRQTLHRAKEVIRDEKPVSAATISDVRITSQSSHIRMTENSIDGIECIINNEQIKRLNLVTDSIDAGSLFGGVATSLILATEFANTYDYELRIITRSAPVNPLDYANIMQISGVAPAKKISFYSDWDRATAQNDYKMELSPSDVFMATSWWSVEAIRKTSLRKEMFYIIQEVETCFYCYGPEHFLATQAMQDDNITYIVNSHYLYDYFKTNAQNVIKNGVYFEPAFPKELYHQGSFQPKKTYKLFFYARPNNPRNMYAYGVKLLNRAVNEGILDTAEWEICFAGQAVSTVQFDNGYCPKLLGVLPWTEYGEFLKSVDVALCLMYTPHPSYPPFDVASSGGVVVTNQFANKIQFPQCDNVFMGELEDTKMLEKLEEAVVRAKDMKMRKTAFEDATIPHQWHETLQESVRFMEGRLTHAEN